MTFDFYKQNLPAGELEQGDLLSPDTQLRALLEQYHPYYARHKENKLYAVLTQSCDLVRRDGKPCKAKYISLAAVRPLSIVLEREIAKHQDKFDIEANTCAQTRRALIEQFLERVLNNNEHEYFYLEPEPAFGIQ